MMEYDPAIKKNEIIPFVLTWMGLEIAILSKDTSDREGKMLYWLPLNWKSKKKWYKWSYLQNKNRLTDLESKLKVAWGKDGEKG